MDERQERRAIARLQAGNIRALTPLINAHQDRVLRTAYLITQDAALAEDVAQSAFMQAYERIAQFDVSKRFLPWLLRIVVNMALQAGRKESQMLSIDAPPETEAAFTLEDLLSDNMPDPETELEMREAEEAIRAMLERLSPDARAVIVLRYYVDLSEREMAATLNLPAGTVKSRLHAARKQLRRLFISTILEGETI